jgi:hypothetical protein
MYGLFSPKNVPAASMEEQGICPISHIPLRELQSAVIFRGDPRVVYDAEHLTQWLRRCQPRNPMTNAELPAGSSVADLLEPFRLPHMDETHVAKTARFLEAQGGRTAESSAQSELRMWIGTVAYIMMMMLTSHLFMLKCTIETLIDESVLSDTCIWTPVTTAPFQFACTAVVYWAFPMARVHMVAFGFATLAMALPVILTIEALDLKNTPEDFRLQYNQLHRDHVDTMRVVKRMLDLIV